MTETDTIPELLPLAVAPPEFMPPQPDDPSGENSPTGQAGPRPTIDIDYPNQPAGDMVPMAPSIDTDPGIAIKPKDIPISPYPQGRLTDPIQRWNQPSTLADPIDRQLHYYGSLIDRADDYKAINGHDPSGQDLADIQAHAQAEAFHPGETPLAHFANAAATPVAASAPIAAGPPMSDTGEATPTPPGAPAPTQTPNPPNADAGAGEQVAANAGTDQPVALQGEPPQGQAEPAPPQGNGQPQQPMAPQPSPTKPPAYHVSPKAGDQIIDDARQNGKDPGYLSPPDVHAGNERQCVSLVRAETPGLPHSSEWNAGPNIIYGDPTIQPGTALATFGPDGKYGEGHGDTHHAVVFQGWQMGDDGAKGMNVVEQANHLPAREHFIPFDAPSNQNRYQAENYSPILK